MPTAKPPLLSQRELARLTPTEQAEYADLMLDVHAGEGLAAFIRRVFPHHPPPRHFKPIIRLIEAAARGERKRVCISMPPRHGKTELILYAIAWWLSRRPADTHAYFAYNEKQGHSKSRKARKYTVAGGVRLTGDSAAVGEWRTKQGGGLLAGGVGGGLTGQGVSGLMIVDDPFKDRVTADSPLNREKVWEWFNEVAMTRLEGASVFVIHTRWHQDDLIGRLEALGGWEIVNIPAIAEEDDILGRQPGEPLWPARYPITELQAIRSQIGEFSFAALFQGHPRPRGSKVFGGPHYYDATTFDVTGKKISLGLDPAASEKTTADYGAMVALYWEGDDPASRRGWIREVYRHQVEVPQFCRDAVAFQRRHGNSRLNIESVGGFKAVPQTLRDTNREILLKEIVPHGDKFQRAQGVAAAWNEGRILVPMDAPWLAEFLKELADFTGVNDANDDQVDALSHAWNETSAGRATYRGRPTGALPGRRI